MKILEINIVNLLFSLFISLLLVALVLSCSDDNEDPNVEEKITSVEDFLMIVCKNAAECPGLSSTQNEIELCPMELTNELKASEIETLEKFLEFDKTKQDCIINCVKDRICGRFSLSILNISDSDLMEPYQECLIQC